MTGRVYRSWGELIQLTKELIEPIATHPKPLVIGASGRSGAGASEIIKEILGEDPEGWGRRETSEGDDMIQQSQLLPQLFSSCSEFSN